MQRKSLSVSLVVIGCNPNQSFSTTKVIISGVHSYRWVKEDHSSDYILIRGNKEAVAFYSYEGVLSVKLSLIPGVDLENLAAFLGRIGIIF